MTDSHATIESPATTDSHVTAPLDTLEAKGLIRLASYQPELEYLFRHALVQDTAYESLLKQERRALHRLVGDALEELYPERHGDMAAMLAMHFEQAGDTERAVLYLVTAARFAHERNAIVEAFDLYSRAAALLPEAVEDESETQLRQRIDIGLGQARSGFAFVERSRQLAIIERVVGDSERLGDLGLIADAHLHAILQRQWHGERAEDSPELKQHLDRIAAIAAELDDPAIAALPRSLTGLNQVFNGELREGIKALEETAPALAGKRDFIGSSFALMALGIGYGRLGEFDAADAAIKHAIEVAQEGDVIARIDSQIGASMVKALKGDVDGAVPLARMCSDMAEDAGATACVVASNYVLGDSLLRQGRAGEALGALNRSIEVANITNLNMFRPSIAAYRHSAAGRLGHLPITGRTFDEALAEARQMHDRWAQAEVTWQRAESESTKGPAERNVEQMLADYATAESDFAAMGGRPLRARVLRTWGEALRQLGHRDEGDEKLRLAAAAFDEIGLSRESAEVRAEFAAPAS